MLKLDHTQQKKHGDKFRSPIWTYNNCRKNWIDI